MVYNRILSCRQREKRTVKYISTERRKQKEEETFLVMESVGGPCVTHLLAKKKF